MKQPHYPGTHYDSTAPLPPGAKSKRVLAPRYDRRHCFTLDDILHAGLDYSLLQNMDGTNTTKAHFVRDRRQLAKQIAWEFLTTMLDDMIASADHYLLPTRSFSQLRIVAAPMGVSRVRLQRGRYQMVNPFAHEGRTYELRLDYAKYGKTLWRAARMDLPRYYKLCDLVNRGQVTYDLN